jgi:putative FmdB family regulatory protein
MPTYDYVCEKCSAVCEIFHSMFEEKEIECPACGHSMKKKVSGGTATLYKSPGFSHYKGRNVKL